MILTKCVEFPVQRINSREIHLGKSNKQTQFLIIQSDVFTTISDVRHGISEISKSGQFHFDLSETGEWISQIQTQNEWNESKNIPSIFKISQVIDGFFFSCGVDDSLLYVSTPINYNSPPK